jgi:L-asparaginase
MRELRELLIVADLEPLFLSAGSPNGLQSELWEKIGAVIAKDYAKYDGFVLTHDIESIHYTAPALASAFEGIGKPFVLTASPYDLMRRSVPNQIRSIFDEYRGFGNKDNLLNALHVAVGDLGETCLVFGNQIHRAIEVSPSREPSLNYFSSLTGQLVGKVDFGLKLFPPIRRRHGKAVQFRAKYDTRLTTLDVHPGASLAQLLSLVKTKPAAVFVKLDELMTMPKELSAALLSVQKSGSPVIVYREHGLEARSPFLRIVNVPHHAAYVFAMWALGQTHAIPKLRALLDERVAVANRKGGH